MSIIDSLKNSVEYWKSMWNQGAEKAKNMKYKQKKK